MVSEGIKDRTNQRFEKEKQTSRDIVLFKSLRNSKRRNGNFTWISNSNKIKLCGDWGQYNLVLNKISTL